MEIPATTKLEQRNKMAVLALRIIRNFQNIYLMSKLFQNCENCFESCQISSENCQKKVKSVLKISN